MAKMCNKCTEFNSRVVCKMLSLYTFIKCYINTKYIVYM